jgi:hypothetical protein
MKGGLDDVVCWGLNSSSKLSVFGYGVGSSIVVGIVKS